MSKPFEEAYRSVVDQITASDALKENTIRRALRASAASPRAHRPQRAAIACMVCACLILTAVLSMPNAKNVNSFSAADTGGALMDGEPENYQIAAGGAELKSNETAPSEEGGQDPLASAQTFGYQPDLVWDEGELHFSDSSIFSALRFSYEGTTQVSLTQEEFFDYLGCDPRPTILPADLTVQTPDDSEAIILFRDAEDNAVHECVSYTYEAPLPESVDYLPTQRKLTLNVAKGRLPARDYDFLAEGATDSNIGGTPLVVARSEMTYGPYDPETHEPAGSYDLYSAEFLYNGVGYFIFSDNLTQQEFVDILCSILLQD